MTFRLIAMHFARQFVVPDPGAPLPEPPAPMEPPPVPIFKWRSADPPEVPVPSYDGSPISDVADRAVQDLAAAVEAFVDAVWISAVDAAEAAVPIAGSAAAVVAVGAAVGWLANRLEHHLGALRERARAEARKEAERERRREAKHRRRAEERRHREERDTEQWREFWRQAEEREAREREERGYRERAERQRAREERRRERAEYERERRWHERPNDRPRVLEVAYDVLRLPLDAPRADVKSAYRKRALETHPDRNPNDPWAAARFRRVQSAYETIRAAVEAGAPAAA